MKFFAKHKILRAICLVVVIGIVFNFARGAIAPKEAESWPHDGSDRQTSRAESTEADLENDNVGSAVTPSEPDEGASAATQGPTASPTSSNGLNVDPTFKATMDSYEAFFDEYIEFMAMYKNSSSTPELLAQYTDYMSRFNDTMSKLNSLDESNLSEADLSYYVEVNARILQKLATAGLV